ncbi:MAG: DNA polymerase III subunit chi [Paracoccaceae bacterium]
MGTAMFYHLTRSGPEEVLALILPRALAAGWRVMLRSPDAARRDRLDARLWLEPEEGFLPHGVEGGPFDAEQPVLIGQGAAVNVSQGVVLLDGAEPLAGEDAMERLWVLFDGNDETALQAARGMWTRLTGLGMAAQYWSEETGRWVMKTERKPA